MRTWYFCSVVSIFFFLIQFPWSQIGCLPYFDTWCGLGANLECMSEMCCTRLAGNTGRKKSPSANHHTTLSGYIFATKARINNWKKLVKQQYLPDMSLQYGELRPTNGWDLLVSLGQPSKFQRLGSITAQHSSSGCQPNFVALNRGRHLCLAGRPSRWALAQFIAETYVIWYILLISEAKYCIVVVEKWSHLHCRVMA